MGLHPLHSLSTKTDHRARKLPIIYSFFPSSKMKRSTMPRPIMCTTATTLMFMMMWMMLTSWSSTTSPSVGVVDARLQLNTPASATTTTARGGASIRLPPDAKAKAADLEKRLKSESNKLKAQANKAKDAAFAQTSAAAAAAAGAAGAAKQSSSSSSSSSSSFPTKAVAGAMVMAGMEQVVKKLLVSNGISFPAQLASCLILFAALLVSGDVGHNVYQWLTPGTTLLTRWLPVFFVPGLAMLPLAPSVGSGTEVSE